MAKWHACILTQTEKNNLPAFVYWVNMLLAVVVVVQALIETFVVVGVACIAYPAQQTESGDSEFTIHTRLVIYYTTQMSS